MRTDSTRLAKTAVAEVRDYIANNYGLKYVPPQIRVYRNKKSAQDVIEESEIILILTEWNEFKSLSYGNKLVIDGKNLFYDSDLPNNYEGICW